MNKINLIINFFIFLTSNSFNPTKGGFPCAISIAVIPNDQISI
jgi:hypothetical protein